MKDVRALSIPELTQLVEELAATAANGGIAFTANTTNKADTYAWIAHILRSYHYAALTKLERGLVTRYIRLTTGYSLAQTKRLIHQWRTTRKLQLQSQSQIHIQTKRGTATGLGSASASVRHHFPRKYTRADTILLAHVDDVHDVLSGPATRRIMQREFTVYHDTAYERLANISVSHIYNLRHTQLYHQHVAVFTKTTGTKNTLGVRRCPEPNGQPGYLRVDSVHQGDLPADEQQLYDQLLGGRHHTEGKGDGNGGSGKGGGGVLCCGARDATSTDHSPGGLPRHPTKGVYHINFVDEVTQWELVACVETICARDMLPMMEAVLAQFPFVVHEFHADNGSEYMNRLVVQLMNRMLIDLSKSRPRRHNDNALVETKNGGIIRKAMGYIYIPSQYAGLITAWYNDYFNTYLNYHRPCGFATTTVDHKGKEKKRYLASGYATPYQKLRSLPNADTYLKPGMTFTQLDCIEAAMSDTVYAERMSKAKYVMLCEIERLDRIANLTWESQKKTEEVSMT